jgi:uncharacterized protein
MKEYILDANAVLIYLEDRNGATKVRQLFEQAEREQTRLSMSVINWGEVFYVLAKKSGEDRTRQVLKSLRKGIDLFVADLAQAELAATLKHKYKIGYADSFAAALALTRPATLVTSDPEFDKLERQIKILRLPRYAA